MEGRVRPLFATAFVHCSAVLLSMSLLAMSVSPAMAQSGSVVHFLDCATFTGHNTILYYFGYRNTTNQTIVIPHGDDNFVLPINHHGIQPTEFLPGEHHHVFGAAESGGDVHWFLINNGFVQSTLSTPSCTNHYKCYSVAGAKVNERVALLDQFDAHFGRAARETSVVSPALTCSPVRETRPPTGTEQGSSTSPTEPNVHLTCYTVLEKKPTVPEPRHTLPRVRVDNEFGDDQLLRVAQPKMLCVPSNKTIVP